tara:strand:+ start:142 stop:465 length:324 start_codon:yes stop_codon:yes gene_type:complete
MNSMDCDCDYDYDYDEVKKEIEFNFTVRELQAELNKEFVYVTEVRKLVDVKNCNSCNVLKTLKEFYKGKHYQDGYAVNCNICCRKASLKNYYLKTAYQKVRYKTKAK